MATKGEGFRSTCRECQRDMRPQYIHGDQWPGTVLHGGHGYCYNCRRKMRKAGLHITAPLPELPPRELDDREKIVLRLIEKMGVADDEMKSMLGFNDRERPQPLTDIQMMRNSLTAPGGATYGTADSEYDELNYAARGHSLKGRRL